MGLFKRAKNYFRLKKLTDELNNPDISVVKDALSEIDTIAIDGNDVSRTIKNLKTILNEKIDDFRKSGNFWDDIYPMYIGTIMASHHIKNREWKELGELTKHDDKWVGFGARRAVNMHFSRGTSRGQLIDFQLTSLKEEKPPTFRYLVLETLELCDYDKIPENKKLDVVINSLMVLGSSEYLETRIENMLINGDYHSALMEIKSITSAVTGKERKTRKDIKARAEALKGLASLTGNVKQHMEMNAWERKKFKIKNYIKKVKKPVLRIKQRRRAFNNI